LLAALDPCVANVKAQRRVPGLVGADRLWPRPWHRVVTLVGLLLSSCATADPINFADGQPGYAIRCDLGLNGLDLCYRKAGSLCAEHGYALRDWQGKPLTFTTVQNNLDANFSSLTAKSILVTCNPT
jgi:hypothetical protein